MIVVVYRLFTVIVDPSNVENEPDVREKDEMVSVELTVKVSTAIFALEIVENRPLFDWMEETIRVDPVIVWKYPVVVESVGTLTDDRTISEEVTWAS